MRPTRRTTVLISAALIAAQLVGAPAPAAGSSSIEISEVSVPATIQPGETLTLTWRVVSWNGLETIVTDPGATGPGTWVFIGGPSGWVNWCPFPVYSTRTSGTATDGRYRATCTLPAALPNAQYSVFIRALDTVGVYAEVQGTFTVVGGSDDAQAPVVSEVTAAPAQTTAGGTVTLTWRAQDATGVQYVVPWAFGPNGRIVDDAGVQWLGMDAPPTLVSGDARDGRYTVTLPVSAAAVPGTYVVWFSVGDVLDNREASLYPAGPGTVYATYDVVASSTTVPGVPTALSPQMSTSDTARVTFTQPPSGSSKITDYDARWSTDPTFGTGVTFVEAGTTTASWIDVSALRPGTTYYFQVRAENRAGPGSWSRTSTGLVMPVTVPGAATSLSSRILSSSSVRIGFAAAPDGGSAVVDYDLQYSTVANFGRAVTFVEAGTSAATSIDVTGLKRGTTYYVRVRATNSVGDGPWSSVITVRT